MEITDDVMEAVEKFLNSDEVPPIHLTYDQLKYVGFDPIKLWKVLNKHASYANIAHDVHKNNIMHMALLGTMRGSNINMIKARSSPETIAFIGNMQRRYHLKGRSERADDVTLGRVAACMAVHVSRALFLRQIVPIISPSSIANGFPLAMCSSTFGSLIPKVEEGKVTEEVSSTLFDAFCYHQTLFDKVINPDIRYRSPKDKIHKFASIQLNSELYNNDRRFNYLVSIKILLHNGTIDPDVELPIKLAQKKWLAL